MKIRFFCDCCDSVFDETEVAEDAFPEEIEALTWENGRGIILQDADDYGVFFLSVCPECNRDLGFGEEDKFAFLQKPVLH
ncbi:hypothetical protein [Phosphitispora fastidiosa]|uniref:hypothetical protein n=1 Tax=Phosphitispora fastidiosa TaxID=2837202 RepID=UPI001E64C026|nr:hypothetical protein [Phosphitispora fastidiosa]MBU7007792.1 hypothetical protein [Phosphitispora fastidiosa]